MVFGSKLDSMSERLRPKNELGLYSDLPRNKRRRFVYSLMILSFFLICFGYLFYKIVNPSLVAKEEKDDLSPTRIKELFNLWEEDEIEDLKCPCNRYPKLWEIDAGIEDSILEEIDEVCLDATPDTELAGALCYGRTIWIDNKFNQFRLISSNLMDPEDFEEELGFVFSDLCDDYAYDQAIIFIASAAYIEASGGNISFASREGPVFEYFQAVEENLGWESESCQLSFLELDLSTAWNEYVAYSELSKCSWLQDQTYFESVAAWFAAVASIWGATVLLATFCYGKIQSGHLNFDALHKILGNDDPTNSDNADDNSVPLEEKESKIEPSVD